MCTGSSCWPLEVIPFWKVDGDAFDLISKQHQIILGFQISQWGRRFADLEKEAARVLKGEKQKQRRESEAKRRGDCVRFLVTRQHHMVNSVLSGVQKWK